MFSSRIEFSVLSEYLIFIRGGLIVIIVKCALKTQTNSQRETERESERNQKKKKRINANLSCYIFSPCAYDGFSVSFLNWVHTEFFSSVFHTSIHIFRRFYLAKAVEYIVHTLWKDEARVRQREKSAAGYNRKRKKRKSILIRSVCAKRVKVLWIVCLFPFHSSAVGISVVFDISSQLRRLKIAFFPSS